MGVPSALPPHPRVSYSTFFSCPICGRTWANSAATSSPRRFQDSLQSGGGASSEAGGQWGKRKAVGSTRCQQDQAQEGFLSPPLQPPTLKNSQGTDRSFLSTCPTLSQFLSNMFLRNHNMTQWTPSKQHLAAMPASHVTVRVIFFKPPPQGFCFKELIFNGRICLYCPWKLRVTCDGRESIEEIEYSVTKGGASSVDPGPSQGPQFLVLFPLVKRGG